MRVELKDGTCIEVNSKDEIGYLLEALRLMKQDEPKIVKRKGWTARKWTETEETTIKTNWSPALSVWKNAKRIHKLLPHRTTKAIYVRSRAKL